MSPKAHKIYINTLISIVVICTLYLGYYGAGYYNTALEERFYHAYHHNLKPSGVYGHGLGILGTLLILIGVFGYMARKRMKSLARIGVLKYWLEFHIFLCTLGPIFVLFHTAFKFGGIVSISFWSMVAVVASGVIGRFIYKQIPRTIQGRELSLGEIKDMKAKVQNDLEQVTQLNTTAAEVLERLHIQLDTYHKANTISEFFNRLRSEFNQLGAIKQKLKDANIPKNIRSKALRLIRQEILLNRRIDSLVLMQKLFRYWHVAHLPFAIIMLLIMVVHVVVTLAFGYKWIF